MNGRIDDLPTIAVVTPTYNHAHVLEHAIRSVLDQNYPNLEYVVVDGGSEDGTAEILNRYRPRLHAVVSELDRGPHEALNKGFALTSGAVMGWLNADDALLPGSLLLLGTLFRDFPDVRWLSGAYFAIDPDGRPATILAPRRWTRWHLLSEYADGWVPQESTYFKRDLWEEAGAAAGDIWGHGEERAFSHAFDFELWARFSRYAKLHTVTAAIGCYRYLPGQQGVANLDRYLHFADLIRRRERPRRLGEHAAARMADTALLLRRTSHFGSIQRMLGVALGMPPQIVFDTTTLRYRRAAPRSEPLQRVVRRALNLYP